MSLCAEFGILINLVLKPWIGQLVDRSHRLKVAASGDLLSVAVSCGLFLCLPVLHGQRGGIGAIIIAYALRALAAQIQSTAFMAALADMRFPLSREPSRHLKKKRFACKNGRLKATNPNCLCLPVAALLGDAHSCVPPGHEAGQPERVA